MVYPMGSGFRAFGRYGYRFSSTFLKRIISSQVPVRMLALSAHGVTGISVWCVIGRGAQRPVSGSSLPDIDLPVQAGVSKEFDALLKRG